MNTVYKNVASYKKGIDSKIMGDLIPRTLLDNFKMKQPGKYRERVYGFAETLYGMLTQAALDDKSEEQAVLLLASYHDYRTKEIERKESDARAQQALITKKSPGRPRTTFVKVQKSKMHSISLNVASYNEGKKRFPTDLMREVFQHTTQKEFLSQRDSPTWHGHRIMIADGTTFKTVDTKELRDHFIPNMPNNPPPLPIGRIEGLIDYYGGFIADFRISDYQTGELRLLKEMHVTIPSGAILLADDLYGTFGHFAYCKERSVELLVQGKHYHKEIIVRKISEHDKIVEWKRSSDSLWYKDTTTEPESLQLRKISITNPSKPSECVHFYTTLMDETKYSSEDIAALFLCRWDIELSFREIKDVMKLEYTRGKTIEGVKKEIMSHLIVYNILRRLMRDVFQKKGEDFFSLGETVQKNDTVNSTSTAYVDRLGRSYAKKSSGRYSQSNAPLSKKETKRKARSKSSKNI